ncbi:hypothetical protein V1478_002234 [Vespula squamosa]|uniref:Uncharacterized protein n=1 Tax=Vespula squamosa TaxID=30214 RepID=A0ABD2BW32_VESSQ
MEMMNHSLYITKICTRVQFCLRFLLRKLESRSLNIGWTSMVLQKLVFSRASGYSSIFRKDVPALQNADEVRFSRNIYFSFRMINNNNYNINKHNVHQDMFICVRLEIVL